MDLDSVQQQAGRRREDLLRVCQHGSWREVSDLLEAGTTLHCSDAEGLNLLHLACMGNNHDVARNILEQAGEGGPKYRYLFFRKSKNGVTPLIMACRKGLADMVKLFIDCKAPIFTGANQQGLLAIHVASKHGYDSVVRHLLARCNADINVRDKDLFNESPLHIAISNGHSDVIKTLLVYNADVNCTSASGFTPLHQAVVRKDDEILGLVLVRDPDIGAADVDGDTPLHLACGFNYQKALETLIDLEAYLDTENKEGLTPLHIACKNGFVDVVKKLLTAGANINFVGETGKTPLYEASKFDQDDVVTLLFDRNADVTLGRSPLQEAERKGHQEMVKTLTNHLIKLSTPRDIINSLLLGSAVPEQETSL